MLECSILKRPTSNESSFVALQVLAIVLGNSNIGTSSGLFFPEGVAGSNSVFTAVS